MQKARVTVTVRRELLAKAERQVKRGRAKSLSAWVDSAMEALIAFEKNDRHVRTLVELSIANGGDSGSRDVVDASVALLAARHRAVVLTSDAEDLRRIDPRLDLVEC